MIFKMLHAMAPATILFAAACDGAPVEVGPRETGPKTVLTSPLELADGLEVIMQDVYFAANAELPRHYHPGEEYIYVLEGEVLHSEDGKEDRLAKAGDAVRIGVGKIHAAKTGDKPARAIIFRVHREGEPERVIVD